MAAPAEADPIIGNIFVLHRDNAWLHLYPDVPSLVTAGVGAASPGTVDLFDVRGLRLTPVLDGAGRLTGVRPGEEPPDETRALERLRTLLDHLRTTVDARLTAHPVPRRSREEALARLPRLNGQSLTECYAVLDRDFGHGALPDGVHSTVIPGLGRLRPVHDGSWWHNFWSH